MPVRLVAADQSATPAERLSRFLEGEDGILVLASRGLADPRPPDSEIALHAAVEAGFDGVWIEVQGSADGEPVVYGDTLLEALTDGQGRVQSMNLEALEALSLDGPADLPVLRLMPLERALGLFSSEMIVWVYLNSTQPGAAHLALRVAELAAAVPATVVFETDSPTLAGGISDSHPGLPLAVRPTKIRDWDDRMEEAFGRAPWPVVLSASAAHLQKVGGWRDDYAALAVRGLRTEDEHYRAIAAGANALLSDAPALGLSLVRGPARGIRRRPR